MSNVSTGTAVIVKRDIKEIQKYNNLEFNISIVYYIICIQKIFN